MNKYLYYSNKIEKGQFLVLFALILIVLLAIIAFAVDGGRVYIEQRRTQNAADNTALGAALAMCRGLDYTTEGLVVAYENGYDNNGTSNTVNINVPPVYGASAGRPGAIEAIVQSEIPSTFANIVGISSFDLTGRAVTICDFGGEYAIFAGGTYCDKQIEWAGSDTLVNGNVHSNNTIHISGQNNAVIEGRITWVNPNDLSDLNQENNNIPNAFEVGIIEEYPVPAHFVKESYQPGGFRADEADAENKYYSFTGIVDQTALENHPDGPLIEEVGETWVLKSGLYYTTGDINLSKSYLIGNQVTFVAGGTIDISGSNHNLSPYVDELLAFSYNDPGIADPDKRCSEPVVKFAGSEHVWAGIIFAPDAMIDMSGSDNSTFAGSLIGHTIRLPGSELGITVIKDEGNPRISLIE